MLFDYNSVLLAIAFSAACLSVTMFGSWLSAPRERFLLTWSLGVLCVVANVLAYHSYVNTPGPLIGSIAFALLMAGFSILLGAARQFRTGDSPRRLAVGATVASVLLVVPPMALGYDGVAFILYNIASTVLLFAVAREYWIGRAEAPAPIIGLSALYALTGVTMALCAGVLIADPKLYLGAAPDNWAEDLGLVVSIACLTGIGALSLAVNQSRIARSHRTASVTDQLTGLLNRRALFDQHGIRPANEMTAVILFDLDHFKQLNDRYGHAAGDEALRIFAGILKSHVGPADTASRLGGEEFVAVLPGATAERAERVAQAVRKAFADAEIRSGEEIARGTVSAGIAFGTIEGLAFDRVLGHADHALYDAKRNGRDRVERRILKLVS